MKKLLVMLSFLLVGSFANASAKNTQSKAVAKQAQSGSAQSKASGTITLTKDNTITLNDAFYGDTVSKLTKKAKELDSRTDSNDPIYLVLNSPGGSIDAGLELIENLNSLKRPVKTISIFSASMGFQTVQGLKGERLVTKDGTLMSHKASGGFYGEFPGQLDSRYAYYLKRVSRMDQTVVNRTKGKHTMKSYANLIENEYWCDGQDCVTQGFADRVATAQCDKSMEGIKKEVWYRDIFFGFVIEIIVSLDKCPLNTNVMSYNYYIDGQPLFPERDEDGKTEAEKEEAAEKARQAKDGKTVKERNYYYDYEDSSPKISKEVLTEVRSRLDRVMQDRKERKVIKGY